MIWTKFMDMHSGGGTKEDFEYLFIEAPIEEAKIIFYNRFGHNPEHITCTCCGSDYSIYEYQSEEKLKEYLDFLKNHGYEDEEISFIYAKDISNKERIGQIPESE